ncbi:MAG: hypothetical protein AABY07_00980 [Nanoarchaeota archaeon]
MKTEFKNDDEAMYAVLHTDKIVNLATEISTTVIKEAAKYPKWTSVHHGYAIILEELDEAWEEIKKNNIEEAVKEMKQVAAMAQTFVLFFQKQDDKEVIKENKEVIN